VSPETAAAGTAEANADVEDGELEAETEKAPKPALEMWPTLETFPVASRSTGGSMSCYIRLLQRAQPPPTLG